MTPLNCTIHITTLNDSKAAPITGIGVSTSAKGGDGKWWTLRSHQFNVSLKRQEELGRRFDLAGTYTETRDNLLTLGEALTKVNEAILMERRHDEPLTIWTHDEYTEKLLREALEKASPMRWRPEDHRTAISLYATFPPHSSKVRFSSPKEGESAEKHATRLANFLTTMFNTFAEAVSSSTEEAT